MTCDNAQESLILAQYGELADDLQMQLEQHLSGCDACRREWNALQALAEELDHAPVAEPAPNLVAAARMRLDEALDELPPRSLGQRLTANAFRWLGFLQGSPALATLLLGIGFLGATVVDRYQLAHAKQPIKDVFMTTANGPIASVSGIVETPDQGIVQVKYNRLVPETVQGSIEDPQIRKLLVLGTKLAASAEVHDQSVIMLAGECKSQHECDAGSGKKLGIRDAMLTSLRTDGNASVRLTALQGLQPYVATDERVRDAVLDALVHDTSAEVRTQAISMLEPVEADSSVRQVLRTVSTDPNPAIRNASFEALRGTRNMQ